MSRSPDLLRLLDELEANRRSRKSAWATLQRLRKFLEENGARIGTPDDRNFETEGEAIESGLRRTIAGRDAVMRSIIRAVYRFRDAALVAEKKDDFGSAFRICIGSWSEQKMLDRPDRRRFLSIVSVEKSPRLILSCRRSRFCASHGRPNRLEL
jgi:hypothetical protein